MSADFSFNFGVGGSLFYESSAELLCTFVQKIDIAYVQQRQINVYHKPKTFLFSTGNQEMQSL